MRRAVAHVGLWVVVLGCTAISAQWSHDYGLALGLGSWALVVPVVVDGYLWSAMAIRRDVAPALLVWLTSAGMGALRHVVQIDPVVLALTTVVVLAVVMWRAHAALDHLESDDRPAPAVDRSHAYDDEDAVAAQLLPDLPAVEAPRPVVTVLPEPVATTTPDEPSDRAVGHPTGRPDPVGPRRRDRWADARAAFLEAASAGREMSRDELAALMPGASTDAVRGLHNRLRAEVTA